MKRFFSKIGRFFWSWGFLKFVLGLIALIVFLYIEEDWRGAHAWAVTKAKWEAKGETFDYAKFIPPPVPDEQNLAALPLLELKQEPSRSGSFPEPYLGMPNLEKAMWQDEPTIVFPIGGPEKIREMLAKDYGIAFKGQKPSPSALAQFDALYPFTTDLRAAAATRPYFRLNFDYAVSPPTARPFGTLTKALALAKVLTLHAELALDDKKPDLALGDIKATYIILSGVKRDPSLVGGLVAIGTAAISNAALDAGLTQHAWNDAQLAELEQLLKPINFLADFQFAMRSEVVQSAANTDFFEHASRSDIAKLFGSASPAQAIFSVPWPGGWWDQNKTQMAEHLFQSLEIVDPQARLIFPKAVHDLQNQIEQARTGWRAFAPGSILANASAGPITRAAQKYAIAQGCVDERRIGCALERYRLAHGVYPGKLEELVPKCIDELPHDIMNGEAYHYRLNPDGTFLLYSVGWNQIDDGGTVVFNKDNPRLVNYEQGDWVWPTPKAAASK